MTHLSNLRQHEDTTADGKLSVLVAARGIAVAVGPALLLDLFVAASTVALVTGRPARPARGPGRALQALTTLGAAAPWLYGLIIRPWHRRWGATAQEPRMPLPGDELVPDPGYQHTRAVTIRAPAGEVWQWLAQIGQGRGGFYSYDWLENLAGCDLHSADRIHPEWQEVRVGDSVDLLPGWGPRVTTVEPGRALVVEGWGTFAVRAVDDHTSRLIVRARQPRGWASLAYLLTLELPHFIMERKMLLGLKQRAERAAGIVGRTR
jgi:hypothetical protein